MSGDAQRNAAKIPEGLPHNCFTLRAHVYASGISARYFGLPVYLVGGALHDDDPRDIDLVVPVPDDLFRAMYNNGAAADLSTWSSGQREANPSKMWRLWARDCAKQSRNATMFVQRTVDFKTQPQTYFDTYSALPRVRLDCAFVPKEARS